MVHVNVACHIIYIYRYHREFHLTKEIISKLSDYQIAINKLSSYFLSSFSSVVCL